ncbi:hypothetical protein JOF53_000426 [Crossiella equi]|uniref:Uncharacterized protein n=1 Tax=Crossiella equi TaxID=130796 RepID=A0ABS5A4Q0_9PSEU|nr:DUF5994 family protein [Crossiella equi]MBP2471554.1 hypothetical protein [Crossiella equi]
MDSRPLSAAPEPTPPPYRPELRLAMKPGTADRGLVDGGWWPWTTEPVAEFPALVMALSSWVGPARQVGYRPDAWGLAEPRLTVEDWVVRLVGSPFLPAGTVTLTGPNLKRVRLVVVPPDTPSGLARAVLRSAAGKHTTASAEDILAANGVPLLPRTGTQ